MPEPARNSPEKDSTPLDEQPQAPLEVESSVSAPVEVDEEKINMLKNRQKEFKIAALAWKKSGNQEEAVKYLKTVKQFDAVITAISQGNIVDLSDMPPSPTLPGSTAVATTSAVDNKEESANQQTADVTPNLPGK